MPLHSLHSLLPDAMQRKNIERQVDATQVCSVWGNVVRRRCPAAIAVRCDALSFADGVLTIGVASSSTASELRYAEGPLIEEMNTCLGDTTVLRLRYRVVSE